MLVAQYRSRRKGGGGGRTSQGIVLVYRRGVKRKGCRGKHAGRQGRRGHGRGMPDRRQMCSGCIDTEYRALAGDYIEASARASERERESQHTARARCRSRHPTRPSPTTLMDLSLSLSWQCALA